MKKIYSPSNIELLLHCYCRPCAHPRLDAPAIQEGIADLLRVGAIKPDPEERGIYVTTAMGSAWVDALCQTPPPKPVYVDHMGNILRNR